MTINLADNDPRIEYTVANGNSQQVFTVPFEFFDDADLNVYQNGTLKTLTTHYITADDNDVNNPTAHTSGTTGFIHFTAGNIPTASGSDIQIVITRSIDIERTTDFPSSGPFDVASLNTALDKVIAIQADLQDDISRSLRLTDFDLDATLTLPDVNSRKGTVLAFDSSTGAAVAGPTTSGVATLASIATDVSTLADIEDGTVATDAISDLAAISSNVTTVANISSNVTTVAGISSDITTTVANIVAIQNASSNATAAAASAAAAAASADDFTDRYYGAHADDSAAQTFITGQSLTVDTGDVYFNTTSNIIRVYNGTSWDDAFVSSAGFLQASNNLSDVANASTALTNLSGLSTTGGTLTGDLNFGDNDKAIFGAGSDLQIYHTGSQSFIADAGTGGIRILADADVVIGNAGNTERYADFNVNGAVNLRYDNSTKFSTTSKGVTVIGTAIATTDTDTTNTGSVTLDFGANQNFVLTLTGNVTLANPTTEQVGQSGFIVFIQDATGGRTVSLGTDYETAGAAGLTLSTAASTTDVVPYIVAASGRILLGTPQLAFA